MRDDCFKPIYNAMYVCMGVCACVWIYVVVWNEISTTAGKKKKLNGKSRQRSKNLIEVLRIHLYKIVIFTDGSEYM